MIRHHLELDRDRNGNKVLRVHGTAGLRGFSLRTDGRLPETHRMDPDAMHYPVAWAELKRHVWKFGTAHQLQVVQMIREYNTTRSP